MPYEIYLKKNEEKRILNGHSWVYANEVQNIINTDNSKNGSLASVFTYDKKFIGKGYINHLSKILVRIFIRKENEDDTNFFLKQIKVANDYRQKIGYKNAYRVVFSEADNIPGLIVDKYNDVLSIQCLTLGIDQRKKGIVDALIQIFNPKGIYERSDVQVRQKEGLELKKGLLYGEVDEKTIIEENGLKMAVDVQNGQKTGYFLDQKENRYAVRKYCKDATVLDCFCNSGGFSLNAATVAKQVTSLDISQLALDNVNTNAKLNGIKNIQTLCADVFDQLRVYKNNNEKFDVVILDPPAFCKSAAEIKDATRGYKDINILGMKLVKQYGFLITCSCSHYMSFQLFNKMLEDAANEAHKTVRMIELKSQAIDHPTLLGDDETQYLKFYVLQIM